MLKEVISELLATMRNEELGFDIRCDKESIRVYVPDGTNLGIVNTIAGILREILDIETYEITVHRDPDESSIYLYWIENG